MALTPGRLGTEDAAAERNAPGGGRVPSETAVLSLAARGIRASLVRLPPSVHDERKAGLVTAMVDIAKKKGVSAYIDKGQNRWSAVHRSDVPGFFAWPSSEEKPALDTTPLQKKEYRSRTSLPMLDDA